MFWDAVVSSSLVDEYVHLTLEGTIKCQLRNIVYGQKYAKINMQPDLKGGHHW